MDRCSNCNTEMRPQASFCPHCGMKRVQAKTSDSAGIVPQSNGVSSIMDIYKQAVMNPRLMFRPNVAPTTILKEPVDPAPSPEEISNYTPALPMDDAIPSTPPPAPSPEEISNHAPALPIDVSVPDIISLPEEAGDHAPAHLANGDIPSTPSPEELVSASPSLPEEVKNADDAPSPAASPDALSPYEAVLDAIDHLFDFVDKNREADYRRKIENVRQNKSDGKVLIGICLHICHRVIDFYQDGQTGRCLSRDDFKFVFELAHHALQKSEEELKSATEPPADPKTQSYFTNAKKFSCVLDVLYGLRYSNLTPSAILRRVHNQYKEETGSPPTALPWQEIARVVSSYLHEQGQAQKLAPNIPEVARRWVEAYSDIDTVDEEAYKTLLDAAQQHIPEMMNPLSFLTKVEQASLLDHMRNLRFEQIGMLLRDKRTTLLQEFRNAVSDPFSDSFSNQALPPRRSMSIVFKQKELIPRIKELLQSKEKAEQKEALDLLAQARMEIVDREQKTVVREWERYVRALVYGQSQVVPDWQAAISQEAGSWEEIWNLAFAFHVGDIVESFKVLMPGVKSQQAPFSHLRFALFCAVTILQRREKKNRSMSPAEDFLLNNLLKLPLPLSYLTWLLLANEASEVVDSNQQLAVINSFQNLLAHSITYRYSEHPAHEVSIKDFERDFQELLTLAQRLECDYALEAPQRSITLRSKTSGTSLRLSSNVPEPRVRKRVGIFVDYENLILSLPEEMQNQSKMIAKTLLRYASEYGNVVGRWLSYFPANVLTMPSVNLFAMQSAFQGAGFKLEVPHRLADDPLPRGDLSDIILLECMTTAMIEGKLDVYIIVSGDHIYYERIRRLLEQDHAVHIISHSQKCSKRYKRLKEDIQKSYMPEEYGEFTIDILEDIFCLTPEERAVLKAEIQARSQKDDLNAEIQARNNRQ